VLFYAQITPN